MKTEKPLTKREQAKIWKAVTRAVESTEFDTALGAIRPGPGWPELAYLARCVIAVRDMARKAKQPK